MIEKYVLKKRKQDNIKKVSGDILQPHRINSLVNENQFYNKEKIMKMKDKDYVDVNTNFLYLYYFEQKKNKNYKRIKALNNQIRKISNENKLYIPMEVKDIKECFDMDNSRFDKHIFKRYKKMT